jgi:hypothetical protein
MNLLERIAYSNGNPQRTIAALRLINERLQNELAKQSIPVAGDSSVASEDMFTKWQDAIQLALDFEPDSIPFFRVIFQKQSELNGEQ